MVSCARRMAGEPHNRGQARTEDFLFKLGRQMGVGEKSTAVNDYPRQGTTQKKEQHSPRCSLGRTEKPKSPGRRTGQKRSEVSDLGRQPPSIPSTKITQGTEKKKTTQKKDTTDPAPSTADKVTSPLKVIEWTKSRLKMALDPPDGHANCL